MISFANAGSMTGSESLLRFQGAAYWKAMMLTCMRW
jgi:hypothetical protein